MELQNAAKDTFLAIIGAGPIGLELAVNLKRNGIEYLHFDAKQIGYSISWWPRNTHFFSTTERIEIAGVPMQMTGQQRATGEEYLAYLRGIVEQFNLHVNTYEALVRVEQQPQCFLLTTRSMTGERTYTCQKLVYAFGDMHRPNMLGIPGESLPHVSHYMNDPHDFFRKRVLVVGGRNSAVESALRCWRVGGQVALSYRRKRFDPDIVKDWILPDLLTQIERGNIQFFPETAPVEIKPGSTTLEDVSGKRFQHETDFVLLHTGFIQETALFELSGVAMSGESNVPTYNPETMETNVPGLYVAGTAAAGTQKRYQLFIENCHEHVGRIFQHLTGIWPNALGTISARKYSLPFEEFRDN